MINITFNPKKYEIKVKGHADYSKNEIDVVCAGVSMLLYTLCENLSQNTHMLSEDPTFNFDSGDGMVSCKPRPEFEATISIIYMTILNGYQLLMESYPKNVLLKIKDAYKK